jgi:Holliday junction resolvase RusA-like endonuclease
MEQIYAELKVKPISINTCWQGRRFKTRAYDDYIKECLCLLPRKAQIKAKKVAVNIVFHVKNCARIDVDNLLKPILDILVKKKYIIDDRYIYEIQIAKVKSKQEKMSIQIYAL